MVNQLLVAASSKVQQIQKVELFTAMLTDKDIRSKTQRIKGPQNLRAFQSGVFVSGNEGDAMRTEQWIVARKDKETGRWNIKAHECARVRDNSEDDTHSQATVLRNLCYFDAVHYCAYIEQLGHADPERTLIAPDDEYFKDSDNAFVSHYRASAEEYGIPFDKEDMPHPATDGDILTDGDFHPRAYKIVEKTQPHALISKEELNDNMPMLTVSGILASLNDGDVVSSEKLSQKSHDEKHGFVTAAAKVNEVRAKLSSDKYTVNCEMHSWDMDKTYSYYKSKGKRAFNSSCRQLKRAAKKLPDTERSLCLEFEKSAQVTYWLIVATQYYAECENPAAKDLDKALGFVNKAVKIGGEDHHDADGIRQKFLAGTAPTKNSVRSLAVKVGGDLVKHLETQAAKVKFDA